MSLLYLEPASMAEALDLLAKYGPEARVLGGGTDLMVLLRRRKVHPTHLVSLSQIAELQRLEVVDGHVVLGSRVCHRQVENSPLFSGPLQALREACETVGSIQIRNVGTVVGNICNASPAADTPPVLLTFGAAVSIVSRQGVREVPLEQFFLGYRKTALTSGEVVAQVRFPLPGPRTGSAFLKMGRRKAMEISIACVSALVTLAEDGQTCREVRVGLGSVGAVSMRARQAEAVLRGRAVTPDRLAEAALAAAGECEPIDDLRASAAYRRMVVQTLVERALERAIERAGQGQ